MSTYQERQNEMIQEDDEKYSDNEIIEDLQRCGYNVVTNRNYITTEHLRFYAWLCRAALRKIDELTKPEDVTWCQIIHPAGIAECSKCKGVILTNDLEEYRFCHHCGRKIIGITINENNENLERSDNV